MTGGEFRHYPYHTAGCSFNMAEMVPYGSRGYNVMTGVIVVGQYDIPVTIMVLSSVVAAYKLKTKPGSPIANPTNSKENASVTMIILTAMYVFLNLPFCLYYTIHFAEMLIGVHIIHLTMTNKAADLILKFIHELICIHVIPLKAAADMVILFRRNPRIRLFTFQVLTFWRFDKEGVNSHATSNDATTNATVSTHVKTTNVVVELMNMQRRRSIMMAPDRRMLTSRSAPELKYLSPPRPVHRCTSEIHIPDLDDTYTVVKNRSSNSNSSADSSRTYLNKTMAETKT